MNLTINTLMMTEWYYKDKAFTQENIDKEVGMVYLITNLTNDRMYVGKKLFQFKKTKQVNKKKKKYLVASDWQEYYGSNKELLEDVEKLGKENFKREILHLCNTKGECSYLEAHEQFSRNVLLTDNYYNSWISLKIRGDHIKSLWLNQK